MMNGEVVTNEQGRQRSLRRLVERVEATGESQEVTIGSILHSVGERSFAPLLLVVSVLLVTPVGAVPGAPTLGAVIIALIGLQMLLGRQQQWLPSYAVGTKSKRPEARPHNALSRTLGSNRR
ncbi:exopolysaccharide biosynthesis protein [Aquibaculum sediminis]|uniref:exopolysaccharide biosynthesis protein n=1 Tax=Aquibaculum sediminis TaxID=3231907 RepID=UPI0034549BA2